MNREDREELRAMLAACTEAAAGYEYLLNLYPGKYRDQLRELFRGEMEAVACLRGMALLAGETPGKQKFPPAPRGESTRRILERAYRLTAAAADRYEARSGQNGRLFAALAKQAEERCVLICQILGRL